MPEIHLASTTHAAEPVVGLVGIVPDGFPPRPKPPLPDGPPQDDEDDDAPEVDEDDDREQEEDDEDEDEVLECAPVRWSAATAFA
jgi:hypothetical protein